MATVSANDYIEWDLKTITAGDYSIEFDIDKDFYDKFEMESHLERALWTFSFSSARGSFRDVIEEKKRENVGILKKWRRGGLIKFHFFCNLTRWFFGMPKSF